MQRTHDVVLADGTFRVVLTPKHRVIAVIDAHETALGPMHLALQVDRAPFLPSHIDPRVLVRTHQTAGLFGDIVDVVTHPADTARAISRAADNAYHAVSNVAQTVAHPIVDATKGAIEHGSRLISQAVRALPSPDDVRRQLESAANMVWRAKIGDLSAKNFIRTIGSAAKAGVQAAQHVGDALLQGSKIVNQFNPAHFIAQRLPGPVGDIARQLDPIDRFERYSGALIQGDVDRLRKLAKSDISMAQGVASVVPGFGTLASSALGLGSALLDGGNPLEIAIKVAYGALPIPLGVRQVTDMVLDTVLAFALHPSQLSDSAIQIARNQVPSGLPRDVFDTLIQLVVKQRTLTDVLTDQASHYIKQYVDIPIPSSIANFGSQFNLPNVPPLPNFTVPSLPNFSANMPPINVPYLTDQARRMVQPFPGLSRLHF